MISFLTIRLPLMRTGVSEGQLRDKREKKRETERDTDRKTKREDFSNILSK